MRDTTTTCYVLSLLSLFHEFSIGVANADLLVGSSGNCVPAESRIVRSDFDSFSRERQSPDWRHGERYSPDYSFLSDGWRLYRSMLSAFFSRREKRLFLGCFLVFGEFFQNNHSRISRSFLGSANARRKRHAVFSRVSTLLGVSFCRMGVRRR